MTFPRFQSILWILFIAIILGWITSATFPTSAFAQQLTETPTPEISQPGGLFATVTNSPEGVNVRSGPSAAIYPSVGHLNPGDVVQAFGRSPGGDWIQIEYAAAPNGKGWVYSPYVSVSGGALQIVEPPPTPAPPATSTIDPTFAAQFTTEPTSTRLPTFTPAPAITIPIYTQAVVANSPKAFPLAGIIIALGLIGLIGIAISLIPYR